MKVSSVGTFITPPLPFSLFNITKKSIFSPAYVPLHVVLLKPA